MGDVVPTTPLSRTVNRAAPRQTIPKNNMVVPTNTDRLDPGRTPA
jgi:hypothetical protein